LNTVKFGDGAAIQCTVSFHGDGNIYVYTGDLSILIATFTGATIINDWHHWQIKAVIHNTNGSVEIRKDGALGPTYSVSNVNTRGGSANNYASRYIYRRASALDAYMQDLYFWDGNTGGVPNDWIGDVRAVVVQPQSDISAQFSRVATGTSLVFGTTGTGSNRAVSANNIQCAFVDSTQTQGGYFNSASFTTNAGFTGNMKIALYLADGDIAGGVPNSKPGTLIAVSDPIVNPVTGVNTATFPTNVYIMKGYQYLWAILSDTAFTMKANSLPTEWFYAQPYASGFPEQIGSLVSTIGSQRNFCISANLTATNAGCVNDYSQDNPTTYNKDNVVGHQDMFGLQPLWFQPTAVIGLSLRSFVLKTQSTAKGFKLIGQSGATPFSSSEYQPLTGLTGFDLDLDTNPDTGFAWTVPALTALQVGYKINS